MAVHTPLQTAEIAAFLDQAGLGGDRLEGAEGVAEGSIHTTYRLKHAGRTRYLRRYEGSAIGEVEHELALIGHLAPALEEAGWHLPTVVAHTDGRLHRKLLGAPAALFEEVPGAPREVAGLGEAELREVGQVVGALHRASAGFPLRRENPYGPTTVEGWIAALEAEVSAGAESGELAEALPRIRAALELGREAAVPGPGGAEAVVGHGDLFPDNLHWEGGRVSGVLDLEMACDLPREWDLAVGLLVFCWSAAGPAPGRAGAFLAGYRAGGEGDRIDPERLHQALHFVAARYATSRIRDFARSALDADRLVQKDWREFGRCLVDLEGIRAEFWTTVIPR